MSIGSMYYNRNTAQSPPKRIILTPLGIQLLEKFKPTPTYELTPLGVQLLKEANIVPRESNQSKNSFKALQGTKSVVDARIEAIIKFHASAGFRSEVLRQLQDISSPVKVKKTHAESTFVALANYDSLEECRCISHFSRANNKIDIRKEVQNIILYYAIQVLQRNPESPLHITTIGSGQLLQEALILENLIQFGMSKVNFDFVDLANSDSVQYAQYDAEKFRVATVNDFLELIHLGMGLGIEQRPKISRGLDPCQQMNGAVKHYIEADGAYYFTPSSNKLSPLFFSGTDQYATQLEYLKIKQGATTGPSVIYDIDLESHTETREQIIRPVLDVAPVGCVWISSYKLMLRTL